MHTCFPNTDSLNIGSLVSVVEAIKVEELVKAVKLAATSQLEALSKETEGVFLQALKHLVIVEGTLLLNMRYIPMIILLPSSIQFNFNISSN